MEVAIDLVSCVGCGICVPLCPRGALDLRHCTESQLMAQIEGISTEGKTSPKIIAFLEKMTAYASADLGGQSRRSYPPEVRVVGVPSTGRLSIKHLLQAFASGADGVIFIEGDDSLLRGDQLREHVIRLKKDLGKFGIKSLRLQSTTTTIPQYEKIMSLFDAFVERISKMGPVSQEKRDELKKYLAGEQYATQIAK